MAAAAVTAFSLPLGEPGVGWLISTLVAVAAVTVARIAPSRPMPIGNIAPISDMSTRVVNPERIAWTAATVALLAVSTLRAAGWLFALCLVTATLTAALALAGGRSMRSIFAAYTIPLIASFRALPWLRRGLSKGISVRIAATATVSIVLLAAFGALLASADLYFSQAIEAVMPDLTSGSLFRWIFIGGLATMIVGGAALLATAPPDLSSLDTAATRKVHRWEWAIPLTLLTMLFGAFVGVQAVVLFAGNFQVAEYANAARHGFFQLSAVTALTLVVLAGAARWAPRDEPADRLLIRVILGTLTTLTLVIAATALNRMTIYTDEYGLTRLRLLVFCCELWVVFTLLLVLLAGVRINGSWLPRVAIAAGVLALLGLAAANPDALIAERNIHPANGREIDFVYLQNLSPDAVPALLDVPGVRANCLVESTGDWRSWNWGRERAQQLIDPNARCGS
ncbi:DUF4153 domain-containing protein [Paractinoplanes atraurantiacus]|uniref:Uncharacterized protein n=1 Tax=Paractinoplanes atraurantiacus TaxID=1036182 RepID=A0A285JGX0_9ACTN|nr:DUF4173 domain-containing protein [Actinoplanes atraurantiacus]SNY58391.1 protein of unknown function [Actinoplanes atraurantiacus]